ncbi:MAG: Ribulose-phosphate 3-epimerase [candidate division TM6 bacterium GW2011_GWF2_28_16]|nr:MAG: Ribulose-phosphate 3-epimerase [candidate division TM6 bacterium GW2011_GWF2_28_16]
MEILPSIVAGDLLNLGKVMQDLHDHCDGFHIDIMDDHFVPNLTWGPMFVEQIIKATDLPISMHLMVDEPEKWLTRVKLRSNDLFIFHYEATQEPERIINLIQAIKVLGCKVGIAINPDTSINKIFDYIDNIDHVLIMSVKPGFSGQKFIPEVLDKIEPLINQRDSMNLNFTICVDGGVNKENIKLIKEAGVDSVGVANAIFVQKDIIKAIKELTSLV